MDIERLQKEWLEYEQGKIRPQKNRENPQKKGQYLHFDGRISDVTAENVTKGLWNAEDVARHSFYPFIRFVKTERHYLKYPGTKKKFFKIKERPIDYAAHYDSAIYSWYSFLLSSLYEKELEKRGLFKIPIAYRGLGKSNYEFAGDIITFIKANPDYVVLNFDVEHFFQNLDHLKIKTQWMKLLGVDRLPEDHFSVFRSLTAYHYVEIEKLHKIFEFKSKDHSCMPRVCTPEEYRNKIARKGLLVKNSRSREEKQELYSLGIPQGTSLSCFLANLYMIDFDEEISDVVSSVGGLYRRYSDDLIVIVPKEYAIEIEGNIKAGAEKINLTLNEKKTERHHFVNQNGQLICMDENKKRVGPVQYLGIQFDGEDTYLRHAGVAKFQRRRNRAVRGTISRLEEGRHAPKKMYHQKFTHKGEGNYLSYASRAQKNLNSPTIKKQVSKNRVSKQLKEQVKKNLDKR